MNLIWELATGVCMATLDGHDGDVLSLAVLEGGRLASGSADYTIKIWDLATGFERGVRRLQVSTKHIWDLATHACVATLEGHDRDMFSLAVLESCRQASGSHDYTIKICGDA